MGSLKRGCRLRRHWAVKVDREARAAPGGRRPDLAAAVAGGLVLLAGLAAPVWAGGTTERVSVGLGGAQADNRSSYLAVSADGRFVAFNSRAANLVAGDTNGELDVFLRDRRTGRTERVSVATGGGQGDSRSLSPAISADGRYVAFESSATDLVPGDTNDTPDVFVRDRLRGRTERVSVATGGGQARPGGDAGGSFEPAISADGRFVAFWSRAVNLVPGNVNDLPDVFVRVR